MYKVVYVCAKCKWLCFSGVAQREYNFCIIRISGEYNAKVQLWIFAASLWVPKLPLSRCSKLNAYISQLIDVMLSNASTPSFGPSVYLSSVV